MTEILLLLLALFLIGACGAFVAAEFSLVTVSRSAVEQAAASGDRRSAGVLAALKGLSTQLSGAQLGITITNLVIGFLAEPAIASLVESPLTAAGLPEGAVPAVAVAIGLVLATALTMIYGELVPKNLAIARPLGTARTVTGFQRAFTRCTAVLIRFLNGSANRILRGFGVEPQEELASARSAEELGSLVRRSGEQGTLPVETAELLERSLAFGEKRATDVRTPRTRLHTVRADQPVHDVLVLARTTGHSRFPVLGEGIDDVVGLVHVKHVVAVPVERRREVEVGAVAVAPVLVPDGLELDDLLETLRRTGLQMAVVVDEFGGTDGVVTVEDLIEELIGDVVDEHDRGEIDARRTRDGSWLLSGLLRPDEATEATGVTLPDDDRYETLGGLVTDRLGHLPAVGDAISGIVPRPMADDEPGPEQRWTLTVERLDGHRVDRLRFRVSEHAEATSAVEA